MNNIGLFNFICDHCGFKYKSDRMRREYLTPNGAYLVTCDTCWSELNIAPYIVVPPDIPYTSVDMRPEKEDQFVTTVSFFWDTCTYFWDLPDGIPGAATFLWDGPTVPDDE